MATQTPRTNDEALTAYITAQQEARGLLAAITRYLDAHQNDLTPEQVHWGHVGDMQRLVEALSALGDSE